MALERQDGRRIHVEAPRRCSLDSCSVWVAKAGCAGEPQPQVHYYLGDRYWRLSEKYKAKGSLRRAQLRRAKAERHLRASGFDPRPTAAAMAMPIPKRPTFTEAIGWYTRPFRHQTMLLESTYDKLLSNPPLEPMARLRGEMILFCISGSASRVGRHADDARLSLATQGASARPEPVLFLGTRAFVHGDVDNCLERSAP